jgi:hypothetical protein
MKGKKVTVSEFVNKHNRKLTRRGKKMSESYIYRLIRHDIKGLPHPDLWFSYVLEGEKDHIYVII